MLPQRRKRVSLGAAWPRVLHYFAGKRAIPNETLGPFTRQGIWVWVQGFTLAISGPMTQQSPAQRAETDHKFKTDPTKLQGRQVRVSILKHKGKISMFLE